MKVRSLACWLILRPSVTALVQHEKRRFGKLASSLLSASTHCDADAHNTDTPSTWMNTGLLLSSFSDGLCPNPEAQDFLRRGLVRALLSENQRSLEAAVGKTTVQSPCCGPTNLSLLDQLEELDQRLEQVATHPEPLELLESLTRTLRFLYVPTAMYALRPDSTSTPGKQRQRARADGKKRRNEMVQLLENLMGDDESSSVSSNVVTITLDLDDGSLKQPQGSDDTTLFPRTGKNALQGWSPHLVFVPGGNTFWLHHCIRKGGWEEDVVELCTGPSQAVYCGASAGAIVMGQEMQTACWKGWDDPRVVPGMEGYAHWKNVRGLGLAGDLSFFPHMEDQWHDVVDQKRDAIASQVVCLRDEDVLCVNGLAKETRLLSAVRKKEGSIVT